MENIKELIREYCENEGLNYRDDYSGRGMFGEKCIGITCENSLDVLCRLFTYLVDSDEELDGCDVQNALGEPKQDSMGMGSILYFPEITME